MSRNLPIHQYSIKEDYRNNARIDGIYSKAYLDRLVVGSFMTITSAMSPNLAKYSFRLSEIRINDSSIFRFLPCAPQKSTCKDDISSIRCVLVQLNPLIYGSRLVCAFACQQTPTLAQRAQTCQNRCHQGLCAPSLSSVGPEVLT